MKTLPVELIVKKDFRGRDYAIWLCRRCPFCGKRHAHGSGDNLSLKGSLAWRTPHCPQDTPGRGDYKLVRLRGQPVYTGSIKKKKVKKRLLH